MFYQIRYRPWSKNIIRKGVHRASGRDATIVGQDHSVYLQPLHHHRTQDAVTVQPRSRRKASASQRGCKLDPFPTPVSAGEWVVNISKTRASQKYNPTKTYLWGRSQVDGAPFFAEATWQHVWFCTGSSKTAASFCWVLYLVLHKLHTNTYRHLTFSRWPSRKQCLLAAKGLTLCFAPDCSYEGVFESRM